MTLTPDVKALIKKMLASGADPASLAALYEVPIEAVQALAPRPKDSLPAGAYDFLLEACRLLRQHRGAEATDRFTRRLNVSNTVLKRLEKDLRPVEPEEAYE